MKFLDTVGLIFVKFDGEHYELTYDARKDVVQLERRTMARALR